MNPHAFCKCAGRLLMALAATTGILLMAACGSGSGSPAPNNNGFSNSSLKGTYVLSISGTDVNSAGTEAFFAIVGTITADGNGKITGGTVDINDLNLASPGVFTGETVNASTYSISSDGRGTGTLATAAGSFGLAFVLTSSNHGLITRFDGLGSGSGTLDLQGSASQSSLGSLAFSLSGVDYNANDSPLGTVGAVTLNSATGSVTAGIQDIVDNFSSIGGLAGLTIATTSSVVLTSGTNGTAQLNTSFGSLGFDVWVIDATHLKFIETDTATSGFALSGDVFTQLTSFTAGQLVFTVGGFDISLNPVAAGGFVTTDANGNLTTGIEDYNNAGTANTVPSFTGTCNATAPFAGDRCQLALTGFTNGSAGNLAFAAYPSSGGIQLLEIDSLGLLQGAAYAQSATSFAAAGYGLNLSGLNNNGVSTGEVDDIAQFNATTAVAPATNMTGVLDENDIAQALVSASLSGAYTPDSPATGRGSISATTNGTLIGGLSLEYYVLDPSTILFIELDSAQVAVGTFETQSAPGSAVAARSRIAVMHPAGRPRGAWRRK